MDHFKIKNQLSPKKWPVLEATIALGQSFQFELNLGLRNPLPLCGLFNIDLGAPGNHKPTFDNLEKILWNLWPVFYCRSIRSWIWFIPLFLPGDTSKSFQGWHHFYYKKRAKQWVNVTLSRPRRALWFVEQLLILKNWDYWKTFKNVFISAF